MDLYNYFNIDKIKLDDKLEYIINDDSLPDKYVNLLTEHILNGGKRLRPIFTIIGSHFGSVSSSQIIDDVYTFAAVSEIVHVSSLIHDDILDRATLRRNKTALYLQTNTFVATLLGDFLIARASEVAFSILGSEYYNSNYNITALCEGEFVQQKNLFNFDLSIKQYIDKCISKTSLLFASSLITGAIITKANKKTIRHLYNYAINMGVAFQIIDDILDFNQDNSTLGKPSGSDLRRGNITLPIIYALRDSGLRKQIKQLQLNTNQADFDNLIEIVKNSKFTRKAYKLSQKYSDKARKHAKKISSPYNKDLIEILSLLESRSF